MSRETYSQIRFRNCTSWTKRQKIGPNLLLKLGNCSFPLSKKLYLKSQTGIDFMVERIEIWAPVKLLPLEVRPPVRSTRHHLPGDQIRPAQRVATRRGFRLLQLDAAARRGGGRRQVDAAVWLARGSCFDGLRDCGCGGKERRARCRFGGDGRAGGEHRIHGRDSASGAVLQRGGPAVSCSWRWRRCRRVP